MELYSIFLIVTLQFFPAQSAAQSKLRSNQPTTNPILAESLRLPIRPGPVPTYGRAAARTSAAAAGPTSPRSLRPAIPALPSPGDGGQQWWRGRAVLRTCKNCKQQYDPTANHPSACRYHTAHFGGNHLKYTSNLRPNMLNWLRWDVKKDTIWRNKLAVW